MSGGMVCDNDDRDDDDDDNGHGSCGGRGYDCLSLMATDWPSQ